MVLYPSFGPSPDLPTLPDYLRAAYQILYLVMQIPPIDPSTSLRTAFLLRLTNDVLTAVPGYPSDPSTYEELLDWLDDLDQSWVSVLQSQIWDPVEGKSVDLVIGAADAAAGLKSAAVSQTERARLKSLIVGGTASLEEWLAGKGGENEQDVESLLGRLGLQAGFDELFSKTLDELGGFGGIVVEPSSVVE